MESASHFRHLDNLLNNTSARTAQYERELKDFEAKLSEHLSNARTIDSSLRQVDAGIQRSARRTDRAIDVHVPHVNRAMDDALQSLLRLERTLPCTRDQVAKIRLIYDSGRVKVSALCIIPFFMFGASRGYIQAKGIVDDLTWLTTSFYDRWRMVIFTTSSPVSSRVKIIMRLLFFVCFMACMYIVCITTMGAYKAHRHRLVWGDRLIS